MERVNPSHGYHWRAYDAIGGENITNTPPPAPSPPLGLSPALQTHTSTFLISSPPRSRRGTNWDKRLKHTDAEPYEGGVRATPPPLLKNSPQEAPGNKGGGQEGKRGGGPRGGGGGGGGAGGSGPSEREQQAERTQPREVQP